MPKLIDNIPPKNIRMAKTFFVIAKNNKFWDFDYCYSFTDSISDATQYQSFDEALHFWQGRIKWDCRFEGSEIFEVDSLETYNFKSTI